MDINDDREPEVIPEGIPEVAGGTNDAVEQRSRCCMLMEEYRTFCDGSKSGFLPGGDGALGSKGTAPFPGDLRDGAMHLCAKTLVDEGLVDGTTLIWDLGSGNNKPGVHLALMVGSKTIGNEIDKSRVLLGMRSLNNLYSNMPVARFTNSASGFAR
jgi:hypothetical protein